MGKKWWQGFAGLCASFIIAGCLFMSPAHAVTSTALKELEQNQQKIKQKKAEIARLEAEMKELTSKRDQTAAQADLIAHQVARIENELDKATLELGQTQTSIKHVRQQITQTTSDIETKREEIERYRQYIAALLRQMYNYENKSLLHLFLSTLQFSEVLAQQAARRDLQGHAATAVRELYEKIKTLEDEEKNLSEQERSLGTLHTALESQQSDLRLKRQAKEKFLSAKQKEQITYDNQISEAQRARQEIEQEIFSLKGAGIEMKLNDALSMAQYASQLTGVRPALILGVLKIESDMGTNLGSGHFPEDMQPASREAFLRITKKLGLDPATAPISARPTRYAGWGGAIGPGQFMPQTWETIEGRVAQLMNKPLANPYELADAFVATAVMLADRGGTTRQGEYEAVNRYLAGPNWQYVTWYGDTVLAVAEEFEKNEA
jgi:peptidoglycan hydrolase CwlO-like protein